MTSSYGITMQFIFGVRADIKEALYFWDEKKIIYVAGHNIVDYNTEERLQKFYAPMEGSISITALTMSPKRSLIAFAEEQKNRGAIIHIYDKSQRKRRCLISNNPDSNRVSYMCFSTDKDERYLLLLYGPPTYSLVYWPWNSPNERASLPFAEPVLSGKCSFCPKDFTICVLTGLGVFRFIKIESKVEGKEETSVFNVVLDKIQTRDGEEPPHSHNYTSHCWTTDGLLVIGTDKGELLTLDSTGLFLGMNQLEEKITCLTAMSHGIVVACGGPVILTMEFNREDISCPFKEENRYLFGDITDPVVSLAVNPSIDKMVLCITAGRQLLKLSPTKKPQELISEFHSKGIIGMDVCIRKPLIATCSKDNTIRMWNFIEKRQELKFKSPEIAPLSVAFHPSGLHLVIGCADKVYIMSVFLDTLKIAQEITIKQFREVSFSHGGQYLAISHSNVLQVYSFYTMELVTGLTISPAKILSIQWYEDDTGFVTTDQGNYVSFCSVDTQPNNVLVNNKHMMSSVVKIPGTGIVLAACADSTIKEVNNGAVNKKMDVVGMPSQIAITRNKRLFFVGIGEAKLPGSIKCYKYPLNMGECTDIQAHSKPIKKMKVSYNDKYLFTGGKDGCVIVYSINEREKLHGSRDATLLYSDEVLTDKQQISYIESKLEEATTRNKDLISHKSTEQDSTLTGLLQDLESISSRIKQKQSEYEDAKSKHNTEVIALNAEQDEKKKKLLQTEANELDQTKRKHLDKHAKKSTKYSKKRIDFDKILKEQEEEKRRMFETHANDLAKLREEKDHEIETAMADIKQKNKDLESKVTNQKNIMDQIMEDNKTELDLMTNDHHIKLQSINETLVKQRGEQQVKANKADEFHRKSEELARDIKELMEMLNKAEQEQHTLENDIENKNKILEEKGKDIAKLEQEIYYHKKEAQKLEKFKFVLDYKIKELKREMNPREQQIDNLREKTTQMDKKLKIFNKLNMFLKNRLKDLQDTQKELQKEITNNRERLRKNTIYIKERIDSLDYCTQFIHNTEKLKQAIITKLEKYKKEGEQATKLPSTISHEFKSQQEFMANSVKTLEKELGASKKVRKDSNKLIRNQNKLLIIEIQKLREQIGGDKRGILPGPQRTFMRSKKLDTSVVVRPNKLDQSMAEDFGDENENSFQQLDENKETIKMLRRELEKLKKEGEELRGIRQAPF